MWVILQVMCCLITHTMTWIFTNYSLHAYSPKVAQTWQPFFYEKVDDFAYAGAHFKFKENGICVTTHFFLVRVNNFVGVVDENCKVLIDVVYKEIIPPVNSDDAVFVVKNTDNQWGIINAISNEIIVPFGKYLKIWGYDTHHALVCTKYECSWIDRTYRAIINVKGELIKGTENYIVIYPFYGTMSKCILVETKPADKDDKGYIQKHYLLLSKEFPNIWMYLPKDSVENPCTLTGGNYHPRYDKMDAYEGDYEALWNTD